MNIIYEDSQIIVCYKEAGLAVQSARIGTGDLESMLKNYLSEQTGKVPYLGVVHRLDQLVEGVLVFAKNSRAAASLGAQVQDGRMKKGYRAIVHFPEEKLIGTDVWEKKTPEGATLIHYLLKEGKTNSSRIVSEKTKGAKRAELDYQILDIKEKTALVEIHLHTGRHHQIRVQMAGAGMPLLGDRKYGKDETGNRSFSLALCAVSLEFLHPGTGKRMYFTCEPQGEYFKQFKSY